MILKIQILTLSDCLNFLSAPMEPLLWRTDATMTPAHIAASHRTHGAAAAATPLSRVASALAFFKKAASAYSRQKDAADLAALAMERVAEHNGISITADNIQQLFHFVGQHVANPTERKALRQALREQREAFMVSLPGAPFPSPAPPGWGIPRAPPPPPPFKSKGVRYRVVAPPPLIPKPPPMPKFVSVVRPNFRVVAPPPLPEVYQSSGAPFPRTKVAAALHFFSFAAACRRELVVSIVEQPAFMTCCASTGEANEMAAMLTEARQTGKILTPKEVSLALANKRKEVKGAEENRISFDEGVHLTERDVFHRLGIVRKLSSHSRDRTLVNSLMPTEHEVVRYPGTRPDGGLQMCVSKLPRMSEEAARKLLEKGWKNSKCVSLDIGVTSHLPEGAPIVAFMTIMDGRTDDPEEAALCANYMDLGREKSKVLSLPLVTIPLSEIEHDVGILDMLYIVTVFNGVKSYHPGTLLMSYGTLEFQEHTQNSFTSATRVRESWDQVLERNKNLGKRVHAGIGVLGTIEKDMNQALGEFPPFEMETRPRPVVRTFQQAAAPAMAKCRSMRIGPTTFSGITGRTTLPTVRLYDDGQSSSLESKPRHSVGGHSFMAPTVTTDETCCGVFSFKVPKDAKKGKHLHTAKIPEIIRSYGGIHSQKWWGSCAINPIIKVRLHAPRNAFAGLSIACTFDNFKRIDIAALGGECPPSEMFEFPTRVFSLKDDFIHEWDIDYGAFTGNSLISWDNTITEPRLHFYVVTTNQVVLASEWQCVVTLHLSRTDPIESFELAPTLAWPIQIRDSLYIDRYYEAKDIKLDGTTGLMYIDYNFGGPVKLGKKSSISYSRAAMSRYIGWSGTLKGSIKCTSSIFCTASFVIFPWTWNQNPSWTEIFWGPHQIITGDSDFEICVKNSMHSTSTTEVGYARLGIFPLSGPVAPDQHTGAFEYIIHIREWLPDTQIHTPMFASEELYNWFTLTNLKPDVTTGVCVFTIPAYIHDYATKDAVVTLASNPLSWMVAATGWHFGDFDLLCSWGRSKKSGEQEGSVSIVTGYRQAVDRYQGQARLFDLRETSCEIPLAFGSYAGATPSGPLGEQNFIRISVVNAKDVLSFRVVLRPKSVKFWGRTATLF
ncbi:MAG: polyprotein [Physalis vein necrosis virus]|nr:MAG: polyprotein [Physalis vein necrosis virus]